MTDHEKAPLIPKHEYVEENTEQRIALNCYTIIPIVTMVFFAAGLEFYTSTQWIQHFVKGEIFGDAVNNTAFDGCEAKNQSDPDYIEYERVQSKSAQWQLFKNVAACLPAFFTNMILPSYSDTIGRRFLFIVGITGLLVQFVIETFAVYFKLELYVLVIGSGVGGMFGSFFTVITASYSYIADITRGGGRRTVGISAFDGFLLTCMTLSSLTCGYLITYGGYFIPFAASSVLIFIALLMTVLFLPETHEKNNRSTHVSICRTVRRTVDFYGSAAFKGRRMAYILLISAFFFQEIVSTHRASMEMIYQLGKPLCWSAEKLGFFAALRHAAQAFAGIVLVVPLKTCLSELAIAVWSTLFNAASFVMEGTVQTDLAMYLVSVPATVSFLTVPMIKSIMSIMTPPDKQGSLFASVSAVQSICGVVANFLLNSTYAATVSFMDGFVFLMLAGICIIVFILLCVFGLTQKYVLSPESLKKEANVQC